MENISLLADSLREEILSGRIDTVIESGTYLGLGSTSTIAQVFADLSRQPEFYTFEASWVNWKKAKKNLEKFPFVNPVWGRSVPLDEAVKFIRNDELLKNHHNYSNIYIDGGNDPVAFYLNEISGGFGLSRFSFVNKYYKKKEETDKPQFFMGENLLRKYLLKFKHRNPLILLDSCGGVGFLEFEILIGTMKDAPFYLILDDINHIKHFRSYEYLKNDPSFRIITLNSDSGWVFAQKTR